MGKCGSCFSVQSPSAKLIVLHRKILCMVEVPTMAAQIMFEEPGYVVSKLEDLRRDFRLSAMGADESLSKGGVYILIPASRVNGNISESEMEMIEWACGQRRSKRRGFKVQATAVTEGRDYEFQISGEGSEAGRVRGRTRMSPWKPGLEPIYEGI